MLRVAVFAGSYFHPFRALALHRSTPKTADDVCTFDLAVRTANDVNFNCADQSHVSGDFRGLVNEIHLDEMVDANYVIVAKINRKFLPAATVRN